MVACRQNTAGNPGKEVLQSFCAPPIRTWVTHARAASLLETSAARIALLQITDRAPLAGCGPGELSGPFGFVSNTVMTVPTIPAILEVKGLNFRHPERVLFTDWSATLLPGVTLVLGGDGRGKTTLLRLLAGDLPSDEGELCIHGVNLKTHAQDYRRQVFWTEPRTHVFDQITPVEFFDLQRSTHIGFDDGVLALCVQGLALKPELHKQLFMLSTGSKRKVFLAAAFASNAALTLLDMPFAALDKASIGYALSLLDDTAAYPSRAFVVADYAAPAGVRLAALIDLDD